MSFGDEEKNILHKLYSSHWSFLQNQTFTNLIWQLFISYLRGIFFSLSLFFKPSSVWLGRGRRGDNITAFINNLTPAHAGRRAAQATAVLPAAGQHGSN